MSLPVYVTNFDELLLSFAEGINVQVDTSNLEDLLNKYFPELLELLKNLLTKISGTQKMKGYAIISEPAIFTHEKDILITGLTFSQNYFDRAGFDKWKIEITNGEETITLLEDIYSKDSLQHKHFEVFYPVPTGYEVVATVTKSNNIEKVYWWDIEYLELDIPKYPEVENEYDYILKIEWNDAHRLGASWINQKYDKVLLNNYSNFDHYKTEKGGVWVNESYGMDGESSSGRAIYSLLGNPEEGIYFGVQRCPWCNILNYMKITLEDRNGRILNEYEIKQPYSMLIVKARDNILPNNTISENLKELYTPIFKFDFSSQVPHIVSLWPPKLSIKKDTREVLTCHYLST